MAHLRGDAPIMFVCVDEKSLGSVIYPKMSVSKGLSIVLAGIIRINVVM